MVRRESLSPAERVLRSRIGAYALHARYDTRATTSAAREAFRRRFLDQVDPDRRLPVAERERRADAARKAHFTRLAYLSARSRRARGGPPGEGKSCSE
jgi:hypothetical protein